MSDVYTDSSEDDSLPEEDLKIKDNSPGVNDHVIVSVKGSKSVQYYIANVVKENGDDTYDVKYMLKCSETKNIFVYSDEPNSVIEKGDIISMLPQPQLINKRGQYLFKINQTNIRLN